MSFLVKHNYKIMYSYEIKKYLSDRNYSLTYEEFVYISDTTLHPQICHIKYVGSNKIHIKTYDGYDFFISIKYPYNIYETSIQKSHNK